MSTNKNIARIGNFTSSEIVRLFGKTMKEYISECNMERRLGRSLTDEVSSRPLSWGRLVEEQVFQLLGIEYKLSSQETIIHPEIPYWAGSAEGNKFDEGKTVFEIKCPYTLKSFCQLVDPIYSGKAGMDAIQAIRDNHKDGDKYFWQTVSNAILTESRFAELIIYMPYKSELEEIRELSSNYLGNQNSVAWINFSEDDELPHLLDNGYYKNLNIIRFEVPQEDKILLTEKVLEAGKLLDLKSSLVAA